MPTLFFANDNLDSLAEWERRLEALRRVAERMDVPLAVSPYTPDAWRQATAGLDHEPEGGRRCALCFRHNFRRAADYARREGFDRWTTTLSVSPHKDNALLFEAGDDVSRDIPGLTFEHMDFKRDNGFQRSVALAKDYGLYRQNYCGCVFSYSRAIVTHRTF